MYWLGIISPAIFALLIWLEVKCIHKDRIISAVSFVILHHIVLVVINSLAVPQLPYGTKVAPALEAPAMLLLAVSWVIIVVGFFFQLQYPSQKQKSVMRVSTNIATTTGGDKGADEKEPTGTKTDHSSSNHETRNLLLIVGGSVLAILGVLGFFALIFSSIS